MKCSVLVLSVLLSLAGSRLAAADWTVPQRLDFAGCTLVLGVAADGGRCGVWLQGGGERIVLSAGLEGDNVAPAFHLRGERLEVSWVNYGEQGAAIALWSRQEHSLRVFPFPGFTFLSSPGLVYAGERPAGMLFLGNCGGNDDLFYFGFDRSRLENLTATACSEKEFRLEEGEGFWRVEARSLHGVAGFRMTGGEPAWQHDAGRKEINAAGAAVERKSCQTENTYIAFGDSITWGEMHMNNLPDEYHPELAYPAVMEGKLKVTYGPAYPVNTGVPGDTTYTAALRIASVLDQYPAGYFVLLLGTNDCINNMMSVDSSLENLEYIIDEALDRDLHVIVSTVTPRKDWFSNFDFVKRNLSDLNAGIRSLAAEKTSAQASLALADSYQTFMDYDQPSGWKTLLEDDGGTHLSPLGHEVIADLFAVRFKAFAPRPPASFSLVKETTGKKQVEWSSSCESDFDHYAVEYGYSPQRLGWSAGVKANGITFVLFPFLNTIYYRVAAVDKFGNQGAPSDTIKVGAK